jgi:hypothetical protein
VIVGTGALAPPARTAPTRRGDLKGPAFDLEGLAFNEGQSHLATGLGHDPLKGGAGDAHASGGLLLGQAIQVGQAQSFQFFLK